MPQREHFNGASRNPIVEKEVNPAQMKAPDTYGLGVCSPGPDSRLRSEQIKRLPKLLLYCSRRKRTVQLPPIRRLSDVPPRPGGDAKAKRCRQRRGPGKLSRTSSAENVSPRSASSIESRSSASSPGVSRKVSSDSRARTVTRVPSSKGSPSTTTLPSMTFPVVTLIRLHRTPVAEFPLNDAERFGEPQARFRDPRPESR